MSRPSFSWHVWYHQMNHWTHYHTLVCSVNKYLSFCHISMTLITNFLELITFGPKGQTKHLIQNFFHLFFHLTKHIGFVIPEIKLCCIYEWRRWYQIKPVRVFWASLDRSHCVHPWRTSVQHTAWSACCSMYSSPLSRNTEDRGHSGEEFWSSRSPCRLMTS